MLFPVVQKDRLRGATKSDLILNELAAEVNLKLVKCLGSGRFLRHCASSCAGCGRLGGMVLAGRR
jgi:hypothetical protein